MKKVKEFNKANLKEFREELKELFKKYEKKSGIELNAEKIRYTSNTVSINIEGKIVGTQSLEAQALELFTKFKEGDFVNLRGLGRSKVVGYVSRNRKYPFIVEANGKTYKVSDKQIDARLNIV